jgi:integrase
MKRAGLVPKKIHDLRRTAASIFFLESPLPYKETMLMLQKKLNHASLSSTEKYISISSEFLAMKMQKAQDERRIKELEAQTKVLELQAKIRELEDQLRSVA